MATTVEKQKRIGLKECTLNDILFPVEMIKQEDFACNSDYQYDIFGYLGGENDTMPVKTRLNCCSERYQLVPNANIFPPVRQLLLDKGIKFDERYLHLNNARFYSEYKIMDNPYYVAGNKQDAVYPMLKVQHSYNGLTKYMITFGYFRLVCTNGLTVPVKEKSDMNLSIVGKHTSSILQSLNKLQNVLEIFVEQGNKYLVNFDHMADRAILNWEDRVVEIMNAAEVNIVDNKNVDTMQYLGNIISKESMDFYGGVTNDFLVYNAINQYINDNNLNVKTPEVRAEMDRKVLTYMLVN